MKAVLQELFKKLGVRKRARIVRLAFENSLMQPQSTHPLIGSAAQLAGTEERNAAQEESPASSTIAAWEEQRSHQVGDFVIDAASRQVRIRGVEVRLSAREFQLLSIFCRHPRELLSYRDLAVALSNQCPVPREYIRGVIRKVRKKIETTTRPRYIFTQPRRGYRFIPSP